MSEGFKFGLVILAEAVFFTFSLARVCWVLEGPPPPWSKK